MSSAKINENSANKHIEVLILQSLRKIVRAIDMHSKQLAAKHNITVPQLVCLIAIIEKKTISVVELAKAAHLSSSTVVGILDRLEEKQLISRERDREDRRVVRVSATEKGIEYSQRAPSPLQEKLAKSLVSLSELEQSTILLSLNQIIKLMEAEDIEAAPILETGQIEA